LPQRAQEREREREKGELDALEIFFLLFFAFNLARSLGRKRIQATQEGGKNLLPMGKDWKSMPLGRGDIAQNGLSEGAAYSKQPRSAIRATALNGRFAVLQSYLRRIPHLSFCLALYAVSLDHVPDLV
jgi:hypothetical protein